MLSIQLAVPQDTKGLPATTLRMLYVSLDHAPGFNTADMQLTFPPCLSRIYHASCRESPLGLPFKLLVVSQMLGSYCCICDIHEFIQSVAPSFPVG